MLWVITNEPELAFENLEPPAPGHAVTRPVHYPAAEIRHQLSRVANKLKGQKIAGLALVFSSVDQAERRNVLPSLTLAINQLPPGDSQRPHTHNSAAITLALEGRDCYSMIDGQRVDWQDHAVMVTPPGAVHSHHNDGDAWMSCLIVQDGGLHYHCRTMDFQLRRRLTRAALASSGRSSTAREVADRLRVRPGATGSAGRSGRRG